MFYLILTSLIWAFSFGLIKERLVSLDSNLVSFIRLFISLIVFLPFMKLSNIRKERQHEKFVMQLMAIGAVQFGLMYATYIYSFQFLQAHEVALFTILTPIYVTVINDLIWKRGLNIPALAAAVLAMAGAGIVIYSHIDNRNYLTGVILIQVSNICFASGQVYYKKIMQNKNKVSNSDVFGLLYLGGTIITLIFSYCCGALETFSMIRPDQIWVLLYLGVIASGLGFFLWNIGAVKAKVATLAVMNNLKFPLAVICAILLFGESADWMRLLIGGIIILLAVVISERENIKNRWFSRI